MRRWRAHERFLAEVLPAAATIDLAVAETIQNVIDSGGKILVCPSFAKVRGCDASDFIDGVDMAGTLFLPILGGSERFASMPPRTALPPEFANEAWGKARIIINHNSILEAAMLFYLTLIFCCQLIGELLIAASGLPVPGPVVGMALLFIGLLVRGSIPDDLGAVADTLLTHLSLLFVPAGVGVMLHARLIGSELVPISVSLVASTILTVAVTGISMAWLGRRSVPKQDSPHRGES